MIIQLSKDKNLYILHKISSIDIANSIRQLASMLKSGMGIEDAMEIIIEQSTDQKLKEIYSDVLKDLRSGKTLGASMNKHRKVFSDIVISLVEVGEQGASLETNLTFLAEYLKKLHEIQRKISGALVYPIVILCLTVVEMFGVVYFFLPKLSSLYANLDKPPFFTTLVLNASDFIRENTVLLILGLFVAFFLWSVFAKSKAGIIFKEWMSLNTPIIKRLTKSNILLTFSRTLAILLKSGIPLEEALSITADTIGNSFYKKKLVQISIDLDSGQNLSQLLGQYNKLFPLSYVKMIEVGERVGALEDNLEYLYGLYAEEVDDLTSNFTTLLEPFMLIFIGVLVLFLAIAIIAPIYQLTGSIDAY